MEIPKINNYYVGRTGVPQPNAIAITFNGVTLYFSYKTLIALQDDKELIIVKNLWNTTTGKHLNAIDPDDNIRLPWNVFIEKVNKRLANI